MTPFTCPNCGRAFTGRFCPDCGQEAEEPRRPLRALIRDLAGDLFAVDARLRRTVGPLLFAPGRLTADHFAGRRARYVPPLRLYVFAGLVFFAVMSATGGGPFRFVVLSESDGRGIGFGGGRVRVTEREVADGEADARAPGEVVAGGSRIAGASDYLGERLDRVSRDPDAFNAATIQAASYVHFLLLPIFALLMRLFWRRRYYVEHLVFGMHVHAFALLPAAAVAALYAASGLDPDGPAARAVTLAGWAIVAAYLYLALRRVYGGRWWTTALKMGAFLWLYVVCASMVLTGVAVLTALRF